MKCKIRFLGFLFPPAGQVITMLFLFCTAVIAQEQSPQAEMIFGSTFHREYRFNDTYYDTFRASGMNFLSQYADPDPDAKEKLDGINFMAVNNMFPSEWIQFYSTAYYSKWEAEENQQIWDKVGVKHSYGDTATFEGRKCWSTEGLSGPASSLMYGPHYHQEKIYKRWYPDSLNYDRTNVEYTPRFNMALKVNDYIAPDEVICRLYVVATYRRQEDGQIVGEDIDTLLTVDTLRASDFFPYGEFRDYSPPLYKYPVEFQDPHIGNDKMDYSHTQGVHFFDRWGGQGVQFCIDWLRSDEKCNLYIDYIEVYDNDGGDDFADDLPLVIDNIVDYAQNFTQQDWPNMKYWVGPDEPGSIDSYLPMKTVDSILDSINAPRLITKFYPWWEVTVNNDTQLVKYYNTVHPEKLMIDFFPFTEWWSQARFEDWDRTREMFQICHTLQQGFWYQAQAFGILENGQWNNYRRPDTAEFKAQTMLALAHGSRGIINEPFTSLGTTRGIIDENGNPITPQNIYSVIKYNLVPRLKGKLGNTLKKLTYTGNFLQFQYEDQQSPSGPAVHDFVTLDECIPSTQIRNWHCGLFEDSVYLDTKYFLLTNLITTDD